MKRFVKVLTVTCVAALALSAVAAAGTQAAEFTASETGGLTLTQTGEQVFTASPTSPKVVCKKAHGEGTIIAPAAKELEVTVNYSECTVPIPFLGTKEAVISPATYDLRAAGSVKITGSFTIKVPAAGCETVVSEQEVGTVTYDDIEARLTMTVNVSGINSASNGACPSGGSGTLSGDFDLEMVGGGTIFLDP